MVGGPNDETSGSEFNDSTSQRNISISKYNDAIKRRNYTAAAIIVDSMDIPTLLNSLKCENVSSLCQKVPYSLPVIRSFYVRFLFLCPNDVPCDVLDVEETSWHLVKYLFCEMTAHGTGGGTDETKSSNGLYIADILRISACVSPHLVDQLKTTRKTIREQVEGLGLHSLVDYNQQMLHLHDSLYLELDEIITQYKQALKLLKNLNLVSSSVAKGKPAASPISTPTQSPVKSSKGLHKASSQEDILSGKGKPVVQNHQKLMEVTYRDVQARLFKNKSFWNVIQSSFETSTLSDLYDSLCERIDLDKQVLLSYNNICRQNSSDKLGITLSSYIKAIDKALFFMRQKDSTDTPSESGYSTSPQGSLVSSSTDDVISVVPSSTPSPSPSSPSGSLTTHSNKDANNHNLSVAAQQTASIQSHNSSSYNFDGASLQQQGSVDNFHPYHKNKSPKKVIRRQKRKDKTKQISQGVSNSNPESPHDNILSIAHQHVKPQGLLNPNETYICGNEKPPQQREPRSQISDDNDEVSLSLSPERESEMSIGSSAAVITEVATRAHTELRLDLRGDFGGSGSLTNEGQSVLLNGTGGDMASSLPNSQSGEGSLANGPPSGVGGMGGIFNFMTSSSSTESSAGHHRPISNSVSSSSTTPRNVKFNTSKRGSGDAARSEAENEYLRGRINQLEHELQSAKQSIQQLQKREETLMNRISDSIQRKVESSGSFETLSDANRPSQLIERYSELLYCELRPDAMDALDDIVGVSEQDDLEMVAQISGEGGGALDMDDTIAHSTDLKQKILFSIVVLSFRSVQRSIEESARQVFVLLGITDVTSEEDADSEINGHRGRKIAGVSIGGDGEDGGSSNSSTPTGSVSESNNSFKSAQRASQVTNSDEFEEVHKIVMEQMRKTAGTRNTDPNYEEVCEQLFQTLFDYPSLKQCKPLLTYIRECCKLAWLLLLSYPSYHINYHHTHFDASCMNRFHSSDLNNEEISSFIWPALVEQTTGHCVSKAIVIT